MKKVLFGTTALVAAGMFGTAAQAAEPIKLSVGGFMNQWFGIVDIDDEHLNTYNNFGIMGDTEVHFKGATTLDNGLKVAVTIELEAERINNAAGRNADQQFATLSGGWGQVRIGEMFNAAQLVHNSAPGAGGAFADVGALLNQGLAAGTATTMANYFTSVDGVANAGRGSNAIDYISPMFGPFAFGVTYTPEIFSNGPAVEGNSSKDLLGGALVYADKWGPVSVNADIAYARFDVQEGAPTASTGQNGMAHGMPIGLKFGYAGFEVGGSYFRIWDNVKVNSSGVAGGANSSFDGRAWDAGIAYTTGPWKFGYQYFASSFEGAVQTHNRDRVALHNAGGQYTMGPGVVVTANVAYMNLKDEADLANGTSERSSLGLITGLKLNF